MPKAYDCRIALNENFGHDNFVSHFHPRFKEPAMNMPSTIDPQTHQLMTGALIATTLNMLAAPEAQAALATGMLSRCSYA